MKATYRLLSFLMVLAFLVSALSACGPSETPTPTYSTDVLYLNITWHQHQPMYYKNDDGVYTRPWVRVHATKDYYDMASTLAQYPDIHVTFNLTPVLISQLDDFANNGAKDLYWVMAEVPANQLTDDQKRFILTRFYDVNWTNILSRFPRYQELADKRGGSDDASIEKAMKSFSEQDFRDLQVWFNLAWFDPDFLDQEPLKALVEKGRDFTEADKTIVFEQARKIVSEVIPLHKEMQDKGQIEVITTPYAHPILPLIYDTNLALVGNPSADMPERFSYPNDAIAQLQKSVEIYKAHYGVAPKGLWPGEGAVAQQIVPLVANAGYQFMETGEPVLAASLGIGDFTRDSKETVQQADVLYRPYYVTDTNGNKVAVFFRDWTLSDKLGFTYSGTPGKQAAADLIQRLENIREELKKEGATGPHIVSIVLDGENAWEYYKMDGKEFLNELYKQLSESTTIKTVTPSEYLKMFPEQKTLDNLYPGAWFSANYDTWIGEAEEKQAWNYLLKTRKMLSKYDITKTKTAPSEEALAQALDYMYLAEGSDWFWWYGADQDSGQDSYFDIGFRALLAKVYESVGEPVPTYVNVPIIAKSPAVATRSLNGVATATVDGTVIGAEWDSAAYYASSQKPASGLYYTMDAKNLYLRLDLTSPLAEGSTVGFYLVNPRATGDVYPFARNGELQLGLAATNLYEYDGAKVTAYTAGADGWVEVGPVGSAAVGDGVLEVAIPWNAIGELEAGDDVRLVTAVQPENELLPLSGPAQVVLPDLGTSIVILEVADPELDDHGPGTYTYPTDGVFSAQNYDIKTFTVAYDEKNLIFKFAFYGPVPNPWGSGVNLSLQTMDVYVDKDPGAGTGARLLLPGRNAALKEGDGWEFAVWAEGWTPEFLAPDATTLEPKTVANSQFKIIVDPAAQLVSIRVPRALFGDGDPTTWGYAAVVMGQDGYPATGVWRVRDVEKAAAQWRFGGAPDDGNHTRIIDMAWPAEATPTQEDMLSNYTSVSGPSGDLKADQFAQIDLLLVK